MRKIVILSALLMSLSVKQLRAQVWWTHQVESMSNHQFHTDIGQVVIGVYLRDKDMKRYLNNNFNVHGDQWIGKTMYELIHELKYVILYMVGRTDSASEQLTGLSFAFCQYHTWDLKNNWYINIQFSDPPDFWEYKKISGLSKEAPYPVLTPDLFWFLADLKISEISADVDTRRRVRNPEAYRSEYDPKPETRRTRRRN